MKIHTKTITWFYYISYSMGVIQRIPWRRLSTCYFIWKSSTISKRTFKRRFQILHCRIYESVLQKKHALCISNKSLLTALTSALRRKEQKVINQQHTFNGSLCQNAVCGNGMFVTDKDEVDSLLRRRGKKCKREMKWTFLRLLHIYLLLSGSRHQQASAFTLSTVWKAHSGCVHM